MKALKRIRCAVLAAACAAVMMAGSASAKGTDTNYTQVNGEVASGARSKYTKLRGRGKDKVTLMVYMIGSDLESQSGMGTADLNEMVYSGLENHKVNVLVETGGCRNWRNSVISPKKLQRWRISGQGIALIEEGGLAPMTDEDELADFISFCKERAPADRYFLIFWDHGGGSVSGFGHDEYSPNDTMNIGEISDALKKGGVRFDFIGFDACLMATLETAIAIEPYADYMIASEESEPGSGWYYTGWLEMLDENSSTNTLNLGRRICDDFISKNRMYASAVGTTLSVTDLSEMDEIVAKRLASFGQGLTQQLRDKDYISVSKARNASREFASTSRLDQIDLVDFCNRLGSPEGAHLAEAVRSAVKYNRTGNVSDAYGLSIYFPYSSLRSVNSMISLCEDIGVDSGWTEGLRTWATMEQSGQIAASPSSGWGSSSGSLIDILLGYGSSANGGYYSTDGGYYSADGGYDSTDGGYYSTGGGYYSTDGLYYGSYDYSTVLPYDVEEDSLTGSGILELAAELLFGRAPVSSATLTLTRKGGKHVLELDEEMWEQITDAELEVFADDGGGYLDLGLDNVLEYDEDGNLIDEWDGTWLTLNGQPAAVYPVSDEDEDEDGLYITTKFIPALLNGERVNLLVQFNEETGEDSVLGAEKVYSTGVKEKGLVIPESGDRIQMICDYIAYDGSFEGSYKLGDEITIPEDGELTVLNRKITGGERYLYTVRLTDIYQAHYWAPVTEA